ncbi:tRNA (adenosine(37)-N6)-dimethylallyltransferase MiaA [Candidatus Epulonipiscium fishelsonii]|uniref:tRNA (Adenosine(37)-N6)-dimethylallyltransferase MiaA n=1 Tax=Candidatus Epulonipiscium fishelsonii TaxID=77094 RepID=A0ACC8XBF9_9FIRM|nr:tRNA (adenosine(37)-N6)-dimethylallyltransferase MiaA [Epulopiscium sp. SCG-B11WGA-EpuloA1]ONI43437.1 tRNA (adenosine(37)-N6)-dimethylallyltransferase MiaA [Epulopiscium sp. SCG-B05WGA-EpuloA1]
MDKIKTILISGPTASGKTSVSIELAKKLNGEIICIDSMQIYRNMDIGTAKVTQEEMQGISHYMIDELYPSQMSDVAWFKDTVKNYINQIHQKNKVPILVGGTGFYINAILYDTEFSEKNSNYEMRNEFREYAFLNGTDKLHDKLKEIDPVSAESIHPNNVKRVARALEYFYETGHTISSHNTTELNKRTSNNSPYNFKFFTLNMDRQILYNKINQRVDIMINAGLLNEAKWLFDQNFDENLTAMKAIGYREFFPYFKGEIDLDTAIEKVKQNTRNYAKRQLTWFKHQANPIFVEVDKFNFEMPLIVKEILKYIE